VEELLGHVPNKFSPTAQQMLEVPLIKEELPKAIHALTKGKYPSSNGFMVDFFQFYWSFMSEDFTRMVNDSLARGWLFNGTVQEKKLQYYSKKGTARG